MSVQSFDSWEAMMAAQDAAHEAATLRITPSQSAISYGHHWMRLDDDLAIFGYVRTPEENLQSCRRAGGSEAECRWEAKSNAEQHVDGYRYGLAFSVVSPVGEIGTTHVSVMVPISRRIFEAALNARWWIEAMVEADEDGSIRTELAAAVKTITDEQRAGS